MKSKKLFWGLFFLLAAVFVVATQVGSFVQIGIMSIVATVLLVALGILSGMNRYFFGIFLSVALLYTIYQKPLHWMPISIWILLLSSLLASIGLNFLLPKRKRFQFSHHSDPNKFIDCSHTSENVDENSPYAKISFSESSKYLHSDCLTSGEFIVSFGSLNLYLDEAQLSPEGAELYLDCSFGSMELYVPKQWKVTNNIKASLGSVESDIRSTQVDENAPKLTLYGSVNMGSIEIHSI